MIAIWKECGMKVQDNIENIQNDSNHKLHAGKEFLHNMDEEDCELAMKFQGWVVKCSETWQRYNWSESESENVSFIVK